jgi:hypothetical protein
MSSRSGTGSYGSYEALLYVSGKRCLRYPIEVETKLLSLMHTNTEFEFGSECVCITLKEVP